MDRKSPKNPHHPQNIKTEAHTLITTSHSKIPSLFSSNRLYELSVLLQSLEHHVMLYYKFTSVHSEDLDAIRRINKLRKRNEIILMHNRAVLIQRQGHSDLALDLRTAILQELGTVIEGEQTRYGFLEESEKEQRGAALSAIAFWKRQMVRHYYLLADEACRQGNQEIALAGLMKGLDFIREAYQRDFHAARDQLQQGKTNNNQSYSQKLCHFQQMEELFLLWQLRERVGHSKYLNIVSSNTLTEFAASLSKDISHNNGENPPELSMLQRGKMWQLDLPLIEEVITGLYDGPFPVNQFEANKMAHFMYIGLLGKVYSQQNRQTQSEYLKLKNAKNVVFLHVLQALFAKKYMGNCRHTQGVLQEMQTLYKTRGNHPKQHQNIYSLIQIFGLIPQSLSENCQSQQEVSIIHMNAKTKSIKTLKKIKSNSKPKSKSKPKGKTKCDKKVVPQKQQKIRVRQQYMLKKDCKNRGKPSQDHLLRAINQNYRSFDSSRSKDKQNSPFRRAIRTETCILDQNRHKDQEKKPQTGQINKKRH